MGELMDDPNREAVGLDPAWVEGDGGDSAIGTPQLDEMTKAQLLAYAADNGVEGVDDSMTKAEIRAAIG